MKCDKLKAIARATAVIGNVQLVYIKEDVDKVIDELKREHHKERHEYIDWVNRLQKENAELKEVAEDACLERDDNSRVIDELEAENRKLKRALWISRASEASKEVNYWTCQDESSYAIVDFNVRHETIVSYKAPHHRPYKWILIWENVERKCRAKAEKYK